MTKGVVKKRIGGKVEAIELGRGHRITTHALSGKAPIDVSRFIPVVLPGAHGAGQVRLIRREDLLPNPTIGLVSAATVHFGDTLLDVFTPTYGTYYPLGMPAFMLNEARLRLILDSVWSMALAAGDPEEQVLRFTILKGIKGKYLKVLIGHSISGSYGAILTVRTGGTQFNLELNAQSYHYFDLALLGDSSTSREVRFSLNSSANSQRVAVCPIFQIEVYDSIRVFPDPAIFA